MNAFAFKIALLVELASIFVFVHPVLAGSGGGSGFIITPYGYDQEINVDKVASIKKKSRKLRRASGAFDLFSPFGSLGLVYWKEKEKIKTIEKVDSIPKDVKFPDHLKNRIKFDESRKQVILNGLLTLKEKWLISSDLLFQYDPSKHSSKSFDQLEFDQLEKVLSRLYLRPRFRSDILYEFKGVNESGKEVSVDFSSVSAFKVLRIDNKNDRALFEVKVFPDISIEKLLTSKIGYSMLKNEYTNIIRLWIKLTDKEEGELYFVDVLAKDSRVFSSSDIYEEIEDIWFKDERCLIQSEQKVRNFKKNKEVILGYNEGAIWWAIPSVVEDLKYPYRHILSR